ncbi:hypothetical protein E2C06_25520 [Dankookia rubra]|uniref:Uncharacterized protein n=1 Tax=Dankookia rubra TaxID=1442381 RepID=A0A4V3A9P7_9PROT|nr:tetratricopeptide repeat-containing protein [Dankookia rubra]TDH59805.1 hypothetical protein E2C06_25520 [Dankookia rubra]
MPFRTKDTGVTPPAPATVDFDALWEKALLPLIEQLGYQPVRADQDLGGMIIPQMLERLYFSDLVLADLTLPNGNVYYEIGIRHAAKQAGCVLIGANWSRQLFDLDQIRQVRYPLPEGKITDETAAAIRAALLESVPKLAEGETPVYQTLPGFPDKVVADRASVIRNQLEEISAFQADVRAVRHAPGDRRMAQALALRDRFPAPTLRLPSVAHEITGLLRDQVGWQEALDYIDALPDLIRRLPVLREQRCLALSKTGDHTTAIGALEELVATGGDSPERQGLIGGRYKRLYRDAKTEADRARYLKKAIEHYERGMTLDLNDYYPSSNLPALYLARGRPGDADKARAIATVVRIACDRAIQRKADDEWTRQTLLGLAFIEGNLQAIGDLCDHIEDEGPTVWKLGSTIEDLRTTTEWTADLETRTGLQEALTRLERILAPGAP